MVKSSKHTAILAYIIIIWVFPKIVVPQNGWLVMENHIKMDDLGVPLLLETPIIYIYIYIFAQQNLSQKWIQQSTWEGMDCLWRSVSPKIPWQSQLFEYLCAPRLGCFLGPKIPKFGIPKKKPKGYRIFDLSFWSSYLGRQGLRSSSQPKNPRRGAAFVLSIHVYRILQNQKILNMSWFPMGTNAVYCIHMTCHLQNWEKITLLYFSNSAPQLFTTQIFTLDSRGCLGFLEASAVFSCISWLWIFKREPPKRHFQSSCKGKWNALLLHQILFISVLMFHCSTNRIFTIFIGLTNLRRVWAPTFHSSGKDLFELLIHRAWSLKKKDICQNGWTFGCFSKNKGG